MKRRIRTLNEFINENKLYEVSADDVIKELSKISDVYNIKKKGNEIHFTMDDWGEDDRGNEWEDTFDFIIGIDGEHLYILHPETDSEGDVDLDYLENDIIGFMSGVQRYAKKKKRGRKGRF